MPKGFTSPSWAFLFGLFVVTLNFFICLGYVAGFVVSEPRSYPSVYDTDYHFQIFVLSHLSHPYPLALTVALQSS
jgi:hypothetical protein